MTNAPATLLFHLRAKGLPKPDREFRFAPPRRFRFDFAFPELRLAVEIEGGVFSGGRHSRGAGYRNDLEKYNLAVELGWRVLRFLPEQVEAGLAVGQIERVIGG